MQSCSLFWHTMKKISPRWRRRQSDFGESLGRSETCWEPERSWNKSLKCWTPTNSFEYMTPFRWTSTTFATRVEEQATRESESFEKNVRTQNSVIKIKNVDELCCARAIVTMKAYCDFGRHTQYYNLQRATCWTKKSQGTTSIGWSTRRTMWSPRNRDISRWKVPRIAKIAKFLQANHSNGNCGNSGKKIKWNNFPKFWIKFGQPREGSFLIQQPIPKKIETGTKGTQNFPWKSLKNRKIMLSEPFYRKLRKFWELNQLERKYPIMNRT